MASAERSEWCGARSFVSAAGTSGSGDSAHSSGLVHAKLSQLLHLTSQSYSVRRAAPLLTLSPLYRDLVWKTPAHDRQPALPEMLCMPSTV